MKHQKQRVEGVYGDETWRDDFLTEEEIDSMLEDDQISAEEEAFMKGYFMDNE